MGFDRYGPILEFTMPKKILLVEDDPIVRKSIDALICRHPRLAPLSPVLVHAASGQQGLAVFVAERPDMVITDLFMPAMDGFALCRAIREAPFGKDIPLLVISGIYKDPNLQESLKDEVQARFLPKPLPPDEFADTILACIGNLSISNDDSAVPVPYMDSPARSTAPDAAHFQPHPAPQEPSTASDLSGSVAVNRGPTLFRKTLPGVAPSQRPIASRSGSLEHHRVARLLFDFAEGNATGTLSLSRGKMRKDLYLRDGEVVAVDSNLRQEALGTLLCNKGIIDENQLTYLLAETKARGHKMGAVLVELGWMTPEEVLDCLAAQARKRIVDCLRWESGTYTFSPGDSFGDRIIEHKLDMVRTLLLGLYQGATPELLIRRFDQDGGRPVELTQRFDRYRNEIESLFSRDVSLLLAHAPTLGTLALREDAQQVMATVDVLLETGLAQLGYAANADHPSSFSDTIDSSLSLERLGMEIADRFDAIVLQNTHPSFEGVVGTVPPPIPHAPAVVSEPVVTPDSGAIDIRLRASTLNESPKLSAIHGESPLENLQSHLLHDYLIIHGKSYYDLLGITKAATIEQVLSAVQERLFPYSEATRAGLPLPQDYQAKFETVHTVLIQAGRTLSDPMLRANYDASLSESPTIPLDPFGAELAFGEARRLLAENLIQESIVKFQEAVSARPDQALYHAYLAFAEFLWDDVTTKAAVDERLNHSLSLDPDSAETHAICGRIAVARNEIAKARASFERSLVLAPAQPETIELLLDTYGQEPTLDPKTKERFLRQLLTGLGEQLEPIRKRLWLELATLYELTLNDREQARIAYDTAAWLLPEDSEILRKAAVLNASDPTRWRETVHSLAGEWQLHPTDRAPALRLFSMFEQLGMNDAMMLTATAMLLRGIAEPQEERLAEEGRPQALRRITGPWPHDLYTRLGYQEEDTELEKLLETMMGLGIVPQISLEELSIPAGAAPVPENKPCSAFRRVLRYTGEILNVTPPHTIYELPFLGLDARLADLRPAVLLCGTDLLQSNDTVELGFRLSRALTFAAPGRLAAASRTGGQLRPFFAEALSLLKSTQRPNDNSIARAIGDLEPNIKERLAKQVRQVFRRQKKVNLTQWVRSLARIATRQALLFCGDMLRIGRAIAEEEGPSALDEFLLFALSPEHFDLRYELGLGNV
jgi:CheY-like chemotaxis protein